MAALQSDLRMFQLFSSRTMIDLLTVTGIVTGRTTPNGVSRYLTHMFGHAVIECGSFNISLFNIKK